MSAIDLTERLVKELQSGSLDWRNAREDIIAEHRQATTTADRVTCLKLHQAIMDAMERSNVAPENMAQFQKTRGQDYNMLLVSEAIIGRTDGNVPPDKMVEITTREVNAGRMKPDDELHVLAVNGANGIFPATEPEKSGGMFAKARSWFGKS